MVSTTVAAVFPIVKLASGCTYQMASRPIGARTSVAAATKSALRAPIATINAGQSR